MVLQLVAHSAALAAVRLLSGQMACSALHHHPSEPSGDATVHHECCLGCAALPLLAIGSAPGSLQLPSFAAHPAPALPAVAWHEAARWSPSSPRGPPPLLA
jgi:hypothetical protein